MTECSASDSSCFQFALLLGSVLKIWRGTLTLPSGNSSSYLFSHLFQVKFTWIFTCQHFFSGGLFYKNPDKVCALQECQLNLQIKERDLPIFSNDTIWICFYSSVFTRLYYQLFRNWDKYELLSKVETNILLKRHRKYRSAGLWYCCLHCEYGLTASY